MRGRWFPNWGGGPLLFVPLWFPPPGQSCLCLVHTLLWSGCGLGRLISSSSCFLPSPGLLPLLEAWAAPCPFTYSLLRHWETSALVLGRGLQPPWFRGPEHSSHGALGTFPGGQELGALPCPAETSISSSQNLAYPGLGLVQLPFLSGIQSLLRQWHVVVRQPQVGHKLGRHQTHSAGTGHCV